MPTEWNPRVHGAVVRGRRLLDAGAVWPEPSECLPVHRCQQYELAVALGDLDSATRGLKALPVLTEEWLTASVAPVPSRGPIDRERWGVA
jgi:hypothetical protein